MKTPRKSKKKKPLTTDQIAKRVFPAEVIERLKEVATQKPTRSKKPP